MAQNIVKTPDNLVARWNSESGALQGMHFHFLYSTFEGGKLISRVLGPQLHVSLAGEDGFPLADVVGLINADALNAVNDLAAANATIATQTQTIADQSATIAALQEQLNPHPAVSQKAVLQALDKLDLSGAWGKALQVVGDVAAKWWYLANEIQFIEPEWDALVVEMTKSGAWSDDGAALIALAMDIASSANAPAEVAAVVAADEVKP